MLLHIVLLVFARIGRQAISSRLDSDFSRVDSNYRTVSAFWAYFLVDTWRQDHPEFRFTIKGLGKVAQPCFQDLLSRLDRQIVEDIALGNWNPHPADEKDDLAAGIAFWTLQWKADAMHKEGWEQLHKQAEHFLFKAAHEGDAVQQSFASLAYAYCPLRRNGDRVGFAESPAFPKSPERQARLDEHRTRLTDTYNRFKSLVPERALRATDALVMLAIYEKRPEDEGQWLAAIHPEFDGLRAWHCYGH